jgi:hypothetical protein
MYTPAHRAAAGVSARACRAQDPREPAGLVYPSLRHALAVAACASPSAYRPHGALPALLRAQAGKNSTRVLSIGRRKQARVTSLTYCRLVPGDIVELLYDQQGRYAFKVRPVPCATQSHRPRCPRRCCPRRLTPPNTPHRASLCPAPNPFPPAAH